MKLYKEVIDDLGGEVRDIPTRRRWNLIQSWRHVYAASLFAATGQWTWLNYDWHIFSYKYAKSYDGQKATMYYMKSINTNTIVICPRDGSLPAFEVIGGKLPDFQGCGQDIIIYPENLEWTMAFTHEENVFGPFYSRREWMDVSGSGPSTE